ncbi:MAG: ABC transporter permease [Acidobacteriota bacterium]|nr:ABC transporter permease [Acidobacteriota bacterium]
MDFLQDVRFSLRLFRKNPGFAFAAVFALALSIGANASVFSVINSVLLRPLGYRNPQELVNMWRIRPDGGRYPFTIPGFIDYRDRNRVFQEVTAMGSWNTNLTGEAQPERVLGVRISGNYFRMLGVDAIAGRTLLPEDEAPGSPKVVVLTWPLWQRRFGADRSQIGRSMLLNGERYTIVGVLPPEFRLQYNHAELAVPLSPDTDPWRNNRKSTAFLMMVGRIKTGMRIEDAQTDLQRIADELQREFPVAGAGGVSIRLVPLKQDLVAKSQTMLWILWGAVGLVLLIVCANQASLLIAKAAARHKEMAVRSALGGSRMRLFRQLVTESALLSLAGGACGAVLAGWGVKLLLMLSPTDLPRSSEVHVDAVVVGATIAVSVLCGLVFGSIPALHVLRNDLNGGLRGDSRGNTAAAGQGTARRVLVIAEVALSVVVLAGAGLLIRSFVVLGRLDPGFRPEHVLTVRLSMPATHYAGLQSILTFHDRLLDRLQRLPGVEAAGATNILPLSGPTASSDFAIRGHVTPPGKAGPGGEYRMIDAGYLAAMGIPITRGRGILASDTGQTQSVALVSESAARRYWPNENPVGAHILLDDNSPARDVEVVGVAGDVRGLTLEEEPMACVYVPFTQIPGGLVRFVANNFFWAARTSQAPMTLGPALRREVQTVDGDVAAAATLPMTQYLDRSLAARRFGVQVLATFAAAALLLAGTGLYALISYSVMQRTREIGVRIALGARSRDVVVLVMREGVGLALAGVLIGVVSAIAVTRTMSALLFNVSAQDPGVLVGVCVMLVAVAAGASYLPARRAVRVDPMVAWRSE